MFFAGKKIPEGKKQDRVKNRRVHLANERTFLAWIRTSLGIMAFGFLIEAAATGNRATQSGENFSFIWSFDI